jgi:hypothetical protein
MSSHRREDIDIDQHRPTRDLIGLVQPELQRRSALERRRAASGVSSDQGLMVAVEDRTATIYP